MILAPAVFSIDQIYTCPLPGRSEIFASGIKIGLLLERKDFRIAGNENVEK